ncbi:MAG: hypothetical protein IT337_02370, partial [Thermomicrobiales bacterium]|nr:hypothetical protein [Thermomicrobiales bacterium]
VRYLVFHRSQYHPDDWSAVETQLAAIGSAVKRVGGFGEATIYRVAEPLAPPPHPRLSLYAPTLLGPRSRWAPVITIEKPGALPSVLALTRPTTLAATWYDAEGRLLHSDDWSLNMPVISESEHMACTIGSCRTAPARPEPKTLPRSTADIWRPTKPGHYVVELVVAGDTPLSCRVDLDVAATDAMVRARSPDEPLRWAECVQGGSNPINDPGAPPFEVASPSITFVGDRIAIDTAVTARRDEEVRGWFLLAPPDDPTPWRNAVYQSPVRQQAVRQGESVTFAWLETVSPSIPPGVYGLTIWFHRATSSGWEHASGGGYGLAPVVVDENGWMRWAGPIRLIPGGIHPVLRVGQVATLTFDVIGASERIACDAEWRLVDKTSRKVVAHGHASSCDRPRIAIQSTVPPGRYRLEIAGYATSGDIRRLSDGVTLPITLVGDEPTPGHPR